MSTNIIKISLPHQNNKKNLIDELEFLKTENKELIKLNQKLVKEIDRVRQKYKPLINGMYYEKREDGTLPVMSYVSHVNQVSFLEKLSMI